MAERIEIEESRRLCDYEAVAHLAPTVRELREEARHSVPRLAGRTVWMVSSTSRGGGVAEMMPTIIALLRDLGVATEWAIIETDRPEFFDLTKRIHNLIHGEGDPKLTGNTRQCYEAVNRDNAEWLRRRVKPGDIVLVHDPQPMPIAAALKEHLEILTIWRCHIGLDEENAATRAAWEFLAPYGDAYDRAVFSAPEYVPPFLADRSAIIHPAINPISEKNQHLPLHRLVGILANSALIVSPGPLVSLPLPDPVRRLQGGDGAYQRANAWDDIGLLTRPIITQVSRWDRLKGFRPLMDAFIKMKIDTFNDRGTHDWESRRRMDLVRLVLAGPDPASIQDDPEGQEVMAELHAAYGELDARLQDDVAIVTLPMSSPVQNALIVNALQRSSTVVVQNSLREGFGLTVTEAMWKRVPILTNSKACGPRQQVRDGQDGQLIADPEDTDELAAAMTEMISDADGRDAWGRSAQRRTHQEFLVFNQLRAWLQLFAELI
jgi:trehalose synthase